jgi:hypothetical protein
VGDMNPSTPPSPGDPHELAAARLAERRARVRRIRNRTVAGSAAAFVAVFGGLYGQLSSGGDPGLASAGTTSTSTPAADDTTSEPEAPTPAQTQTQPQTATDPQPSTDQTWSSSTPSPVTTSQS